MIRIGLTSFNEHTSLTGKKNASLFDYAGYLPLVELDTAYYGLPRKSTVENWLSQVPKNFRFVVKVPDKISTQRKLENETLEEVFQQFYQVMAPMIDSGQLYCFLAQFPAQFKCTKKNVTYLEKLRQLFSTLPVALELRDFSWYNSDFHDKTMQFMTTQKFSLVMLDEPQLLDTVPLDLTVTNPAFTLFRFHGRNQAFWKDNSSDWRKKRTLYRYNEAELTNLAEKIQTVAENTQEIGIIFNNNSGGDAADNAVALKKILELDYQDLNPSQLGLF